MTQPEQWPGPRPGEVTTLNRDLLQQAESYRLRRTWPMAFCVACGAKTDCNAPLSPDRDGPLCPDCAEIVYPPMPRAA